MKLPKYHRMGTRALLLESQQAQAQLPLQRIYWRLDALSQSLAGLIESVPGMNNLLLLFDSMESREHSMPAIAHLWEQSREEDFEHVPACVTVAVRYGGAGGSDLAEVAAHCAMSIDELVKRHSTTEYTVFCLGAHPGFAYLGGLDQSLHMPRRTAPRQLVPAGSVAIGGSQTGVTAASLPSGWNLIGTTDSLFFDYQATPPTLVAPGDRVRFEALEILA
jgi:KipI family sensor histidine kinase inhibitor